MVFDVLSYGITAAGILVFILIFALVFFNVILGVFKSRHSKKEPLITVPAKVVKTLQDTSVQFSQIKPVRSKATVNNYYITCEFESADRKVFEVSAQEYAQITEGDNGRLSFRGDVFISFERLI